MQQDHTRPHGITGQVSYQADRQGHGLDTPALTRQRRTRTRAVQLPWKNQMQYQMQSQMSIPAPPTILGSGPPFPHGSDEREKSYGKVPSSRAEAVAAAAKLRQDLHWLSLQTMQSEDNRLRAEVSLWDETFEEIVRQVKAASFRCE